MTEKSRQKLSLPEKIAETNPRRKPVRGGAPRKHRKAEPSLERRKLDAVPPVQPLSPRKSQSLSEAVPRQPQAQNEKRVPTAREPAQDGVRVSKLMAERGLCSRREADTYIERGWVYVDGRRVAFHVKARDEFDVIGEGEHERVIVTWDKFISRVNDKAKRARVAGI